LFSRSNALPPGVGTLTRRLGGATSLQAERNRLGRLRRWTRLCWRWWRYCR